MSIAERDAALTLLERLGPDERLAALHFMQFLLLPPALPAAELASPDDEAVTAADLGRLREGKRWFAARDGRGIPMVEVLAGFGDRQAELAAMRAAAKELDAMIEVWGTSEDQLMDEYKEIRRQDRESKPDSGSIAQ